MAIAAEPSPSWIKLRDNFLSSLGKAEKNIILPSFPKLDCEQKVKEMFRLEEVNLAIHAKGALSAADAVQDFGTRVLVQPCFAKPFEAGDFFFVTSEEDLQQLMVLVFDDPSLASYFYEKDKLLGFYYYFLAEICKVVRGLSWLSGLAAKVSGDLLFSARGLPSTVHFVEIACSLDGKTIRFGLLFPEETYLSCQKYLESQKQGFDISTVDPMTPLTLSVDVGYCRLSQNEISQVVPGGFILLDSCLFDPDSGDSGAILSVGDKQFFGGRFLQPGSGEFKITSFPNLQPDSSSFGNPFSPPPVAGVKLVAEVAQYALTVEEFYKLTHGSVLDFYGMHPSRGVDLMLDGHKFGRGEIISLGDVLGIRVLEM